MNKQTFVLDFDDFCSNRPGLDLLMKVKEHLPNFKCTLFTVPFHIKYFTGELKMEHLQRWGKLVKEIDWIELAPHGFAHLQGEWLEKDAKNILRITKAMENLFARLELKYVKVFKAPHWQLSKEAEEILADRGYTIALDRNNPVSYTDAPKYVFNWSIDEPIPQYHMVKGHGHMEGTNNGLEKCYLNLLKIPQDAQFKFISEYLKDNG